MTAQAAFDFQEAMRPVRCSRCGHGGNVPQSLEMSTKLRCAKCGARLQLGQVIGAQQVAVAHVPPRRRSAATVAAALEILQRYGRELNDRLDDLFVDGAAP